jgi:large subunit ribosomal protein L17
VRHQRHGRKLGRDASHRKALFSTMAGQLFTLARKDPMNVAAQRQAVAYLRSKDAVHTLFHEVAPRFTERPGGYTRIVKLGPRQGDAAPMAYVELVD